MWLLVLIGVAAMIVHAENRYSPPKHAEPYLWLIYNTEKAENIPHNLLVKLIETESNFSRSAVNVSSGAAGIAQIVKKWHPTVDPYDPLQAIPYAGHYLRENYDRFRDWRKALAAYNWGPGNLSKAIKEHGRDWLAHAPLETRNYVEKITLGVLI